MAVKVTDAGASLLLEVAFGATAKVTSFTVQLFTDALGLADTDTNTTHDVPDATGGYVDKSLTNDAAVALSGGIPEAAWGPITWTFTGPIEAAASITGYQVLAGTTLLWAETLSVPFTPANNGDQFTLTPKFQLGNGTPT